MKNTGLIENLISFQSNVVGNKMQSSGSLSKTTSMFDSILNFLYAQFEKAYQNTSSKSKLVQGLSNQNNQNEMYFNNLLPSKNENPSENQIIFGTLLNQLSQLLNDVFLTQNNKQLEALLQNLRKKLLTLKENSCNVSEINQLINILSGLSISLQQIKAISHEQDIQGTSLKEATYRIQEALNKINQYLQENVIQCQNGKAVGKNGFSQNSVSKDFFKHMETDNKINSVEIGDNKEKIDMSLKDQHPIENTSANQKQNSNFTSLTSNSNSSTKTVNLLKDSILQDFKVLINNKGTNLLKSGQLKHQINDKSLIGNEAQLNLQVLKKENRTHSKGTQSDLGSVVAEPKINFNINKTAKAPSTANQVKTWDKTFNQLAKDLKLQIKTGQKEATIQLEPPSLGKVHVKIDMNNGLLKIHFIASQISTKEIIENNLNLLHQALSQHGLQLGEFSVALGGERGFGQPQTKGNKTPRFIEDSKEIKEVEQSKQHNHLSNNEIDFWA